MFGAVRQQSGESSTEYRFAGQQHEASTGLLYLRARHYDPATGRFLGRDPFPGVAGLPQSQHPYAYAHNSPAVLTDPTGEVVPAVAAVAGGLIRVGAARAAARGQRPRLGPNTYLGTNVDTLTKNAVVQSGPSGLAVIGRHDLPGPNGLTVTGRGVYGPDFYNTSLRVWWDMTTPQQWKAHVRLYGDAYGAGIPLFWR